MRLCSYVIFLLRDQWLIERLSEAMGAALFGKIFSPIPSRISARNLQSIKTFLTLELSQYRKRKASRWPAANVPGTAECKAAARDHAAAARRGGRICGARSRPISRSASWCVLVRRSAIPRRFVRSGRRCDWKVTSGAGVIAVRGAAVRRRFVRPARAPAVRRRPAPAASAPTRRRANR